MDLELAIEEIEKTIEKIREKNKTVPIIVEGEKDVKALHFMDIKGEIITIHCGMEIANLCDYIASKYSEIIILTDWDKRGWYLCRKLEHNLKGRTKCITEYRLALMKNSMVKDIESMPKFIKNLRNKVKGKNNKKERK